MDKIVFTELAMNAEGKVPEWVHILPAGQAVQAVDGRSWIMPDAAKVIARSMTGVDIPIDYEHQTDDPKRRSGNGPIPAAGWIKKLEARADGIWGQVEWTPRAVELLSACEYRYLSPVFTYDTETLQIGKITGAGLVHTPALRMTALASAQSGQDQNAPEGQSQSDRAAVMLGQILTALGLPNGSSAEDILAAIAKLKDPKTVPQEVLQDVLRERYEAISTLAEETVKTRVGQALASGYISPAMTGWATDLCRSDPDSFDAFCRAAPPMAGHLGKSQVNEVFLRENLNLGKGAIEGSIERDISSALGVSLDKLK
jgi:phage I-like protein